MRIKLFLVFIILSTIACTIQMYPEVVVENKEIQIHEVSTINPSTTMSEVIAEKSLRLRDLPEELGGKELTIMSSGSKMRILYCQVVERTKWAFGYYTDDSGKNWVGWASAKYLKDACK